MSTVDLHTLTGAYALGALSEQESAEFAGHLAQCQACTQEVRELRETAPGSRWPWPRCLRPRCAPG